MSMLSASEPVKASEDTDQNPEKIEKHGYILGRVIGKGSHAKVRLAHFIPENQRLAVKVIAKATASPRILEHFLPRELEVMRELRHENISTLHRVIDTGTHVYMFMELVEGGDLLEYIKSVGPLSDGESRRMFGQLVSAVRYLHGLNIAHRDLKCENILLDSRRNVKVTDFGFARSCLDRKTGKRILSETYCGSLAYAAPEVLMGVPYNPKMSDAWSLGVILYIMVCGSKPYDDTNLARMLKIVLTTRICFPCRLYDSLDVACKELIHCILQPDVTKRATVEQIHSSAWMAAARLPAGDS